MEACIEADCSEDGKNDLRPYVLWLLNEKTLHLDIPMFVSLAESAASRVPIEKLLGAELSLVERTMLESASSAGHESDHSSSSSIGSRRVVIL